MAKRTPQARKKWIEHLHRDALELFAYEEFDDAMELWQKALQVDPRIPEIVRCVTACEKRIETISTARHVPLVTVAPGDDVEDPAEAEEWNRRAEESLREDDWAEAIGHWQSALRTDPLNATAYGGIRGTLEETEEQEVEAEIASFEEGIIDELPRRRVIPWWAKVIAVLLVPVLYMTLSYVNNRTFWIYYKPNTRQVDFYQGRFFPTGKEKIQTFDVGVDPGWYDLIQDPVLRRKLTGSSVWGYEAFDSFMLDLFVVLGQESLRVGTLESLQHSLYYFRRAREYMELQPATFQGSGRELPDLARLISGTYYELGKLHETHGDLEQALAAYLNIRDFVWPYQDADRRIEVLRARIDEEDA